ncbi:MAG: hypothetical protein C4334_01660 [Pyrinomonas sp.]|uniref:glycoside hydrolase family 38 N-terminal domain-containing protein n=1 Tax=Pyrinomonas sp. TaxID=2080306 RepID=UPI0033302FC6
MNGYRARGLLLLFAALCALTSAARAATQDLARLPDGGFFADWLISSFFPTEIDAGAFENFQRFNIERLPERDWLAPFGGPAAVQPKEGVVLSAGANAPGGNKEDESASGSPLPEVGARSERVEEKTVELRWTAYRATSEKLDFARIFPSIGTAYAATRFASPDDRFFFIETDGFTGAIWLNGERIYDGFKLEAQRVVLARARAGANLLLVRASGVRNDPWRKDGGWAAHVRIWHARALPSGLVAGAFRSTGLFLADGSGARERLRLAVANANNSLIRDVRFEVRDGERKAQASLVELPPGELREVEIEMPAAAKEPTERRADVRLRTGEDEIAWTASWTQPAVPPDGRIFYLEGFHVDPVYLHDQREYARITLSNMNQYMNSMRADGRYGVFFSELDYLKPYDDTHPEDRALLRERVRSGRVGTGGSYNQFNEPTIGGEAIVRNILYGRLYHESVLGDRPRALALWDVFGHVPQISQIARKSGFDGIVWSKKIQGFQPLFFDYALDGSRLLHRRLDYAYSFSGFGSGKNYSLDAFQRMTLRKFEEARSFGSAVDLRINAADFTPPWTNLAGNVERLERSLPKVEVTGQAQTRFFNALRAEVAAGKVRVPVTSRDKLFFHVGVAAARSDLKIAHRRAENMILAAERFGAIAYAHGANYPDLALDKAWRQILFGSHHDAITGTPSDNAFLDLVHGYREAYELAREARDDALRFIISRINTRAPERLRAPRSALTPLVIFNPLAWERTDLAQAHIRFASPVRAFLVRDGGGAIVPHRLVRAERDAVGRLLSAEIVFVARAVPSLGYKTFFIDARAELRTEIASGGEGNAIENEFYRVEVDPARGGAVRRIYDKRARREIVRALDGHLANEIAALEEDLSKKNVIYPAWEFWTTGKRRFSTAQPARVAVRREGPTQRIVVEGVLPAMRSYRQTIELHDGIARIDFRTELIEYNGKNELFVINFPLALTGGALVTEERFGVVARNGSRAFLDFRSNTDKLVSGAPVYAVYNWAGYGQTLRLVFSGSGGELVASVALKPTALVRPPGELYDELTERIVAALIRRGISVTPFADDGERARRALLTIEDSTMPRRVNDDLGYHSFRILLGGPAESEHVREALVRVDRASRARFERELQSTGRAFLFFHDEMPNGWPPMPTLIIAGRDAENVRRAVEELLAPISQGKEVLRLSAEALATAERERRAHVPDYGVAIINGGTIAAILERPETLTLFLTHTAPWPGVNLPFDFTPEHKTHVFSYALYPHEGDWRRAQVVRRGYEFNNPLIAVQTAEQSGPLPPEHSFLRLSAENVVLSALKLAGNPQASFRASEAEGERAFILRLYETEGRATAVEATFDEAIGEVERADLIERKITSSEDVRQTSERSFASAIGSFSIETFKVPVARRAATGDAIGARRELVQPVPARYWMHNMGAAPIGNDPIKVTVRPVEQMGQLASFAYDDKYNQGGITTVAARVFVVNNLLDRRARGRVEIEVAPDWRAVPSAFDYDIEPGGWMARDVVILSYPVKKGLEWARASGLVKARTEFAGQTYQDVLEIGRSLRLDWRIERTGERVRIVVHNPHRQRVEGSVALILPPEVWLDDAGRTTRERGFSVGPGETTTLDFGAPQRGAWAIARLAYNGHVEYERADGEGER